MANVLTSIGTFGDFSYLNIVGGVPVSVEGAVQINLKHYADVFDNGVIVIRDLNVTTRSVEATCTYNANLSHINALTAVLPLQPGSYYIQNLNNQVKIKTAGSDYMTLAPY